VPVSTGETPRLEEIDLTEHAVAQYRERVRPALELAGARAELAQLVLTGQILPQPPDWTRAGSPKPFYLVLGGSLALPLAPQAGRWVTTTCLVNGTLTSRRRQERQQSKAARAAGKRARRRARW
jgi:hypothetical protein